MKPANGPHTFTPDPPNSAAVSTGVVDDGGIRFSWGYLAWKPDLDAFADTEKSIVIRCTSGTRFASLWGAESQSGAWL